MSPARRWRLVWLFWLIPCSLLQAHKPSDSYLWLNADSGAHSTLRWDIALVDLEYALGLDIDADSRITWGELLHRRQAVVDYARSHLWLLSDGAPCDLELQSLRASEHSDGAYAVLDYLVRCNGAAMPDTISYNFMFALDPTHRGILQQNRHGRIDARHILSPSKPEIRLSTATQSSMSVFLDYCREGVWHIWIGFDHILFILTLLLPAVLIRQHGYWRPRTRFLPSLLELIKIVTAFTVAHSITLMLAALQVVALPSRPVEIAIAASILIAAVNNIFPFLPLRQWTIAFLFGLIHGFGFASVLGDLGLDIHALLASLLGFNVGVELGQLTIVALVFPLAFALRNAMFYRRWVYQGGSMLMAAIAVLWVTERSLNLKMMPF